jgi:hypothetical protein
LELPFESSLGDDFYPVFVDFIIEIPIADIPPSQYKGLKRTIYRLSTSAISFGKSNVNSWRDYYGVCFPKRGRAVRALIEDIVGNTRCMGAFSNR